MILWKCCTQYASKSGKLSSVHRTGKGQFHSSSKERQCQRLFKLHTIALISHASKVMLKILQARLQQAMVQWTMNFQMFKLVLEKSEEPDHIANIPWIIEKARVPEKHLLLLYLLCQSLWLCGSQENVENSERDGNARPPDLPLEKPVCRSGSNS